MITVRLVRAVGSDRSVDGHDPAELRAWLVELRTTLAPVSVAGYVRTLRVLGNWLAAGTLKVRGKGSRERMVPVGSTARQAIVSYLGQRGPGQPEDALFLGRRGEISSRGLQHMLRRLKGRVGVTGRLSPHSLRHTFARSYLVNGGDVFSLQRILGHTTLDMVKRYVALAEFEIVRRLHAFASPADRLLIGPRVSVILPQAIYRRLCGIATELRMTVEALVRHAAECLVVPPRPVSATSATGS
jgi:Phage integrase family